MDRLLTGAQLSTTVLVFRLVDKVGPRCWNVVPGSPTANRSANPCACPRWADNCKSWVALGQEIARVRGLDPADVASGGWGIVRVGKHADEIAGHVAVLRAEIDNL